MGPTASGKTDLAVELASALPLRHRQRGFRPGLPRHGHRHRQADRTCWPQPASADRYLRPAESYSAARFRADALREMADISARGRVPLLGGGTMLYFRALQRGLSPLPAATGRSRRRLDAEAAVRGWAAAPSAAGRRRPGGSRPHPSERSSADPARPGGLRNSRSADERSVARGGRALRPYRLLKLVRAPGDRAFCMSGSSRVSCSCWSWGSRARCGGCGHGGSHPGCRPCAVSAIGKC